MTTTPSDTETPGIGAASSSVAPIEEQAAWPPLPYEGFAPTAYLLHRALQAVGKLKLLCPFEPQWAHVPLWLGPRGLDTGPIPLGERTFSVEVDLLSHHLRASSDQGRSAAFRLGPGSVAAFAAALGEALRAIGVEVPIYPMPQEVAQAIPFDRDTALRPYRHDLVEAWLAILRSTERVLARYHARYLGRTPPIGLMWGTFDLRDARYRGKSVPITEQNAGYIRRNAMNEEQVECGFWPGSEAYPRPAFFSFTFPQPDAIEQALVAPAAARWDPVLRQFVLDYDHLRASASADEDLLAFFESAYQAGATRAGWDPHLLSSGQPI